MRETPTQRGSKFEEATLHYSLGYRLLATASLFGFGSILGSALFDQSHNDAPTRQIVCTFFLLLIIGMFLEVVFVKITFNEEGICATSPWRGVNRLRWCDIASHTYIQIGDWHVLSTRNGKKIRISRRLSKLEMLGKALLRREIITLDEMKMWRTAGSLPNEQMGV